jgi:tRNA G18 (ribose-2'-O)-methylase SpoU
MKHNIIAVLDDIRSALNVGAIFRSSDAAGITELVLAGITPYPPHNRIPKTALGAIDSINWKHTRDKQQVITELQEKQIKIVSVELTENSETMWDFSFPEPVAVIFGNEVSGVSPEFLAASSAVVKIPMFGQKESLNVATCFGIIIYEIIRQYTQR